MSGKMDLKNGLSVFCPRKNTVVWLLLILACDVFFSFVAWLIAPGSFINIVIMIVIFSAVIFIVGYVTAYMRERKQMEALLGFLQETDEGAQQRLLSVLDSLWHPAVRLAYERLRDQERVINEKALELLSYQEFIEAWTHEIKTPLSLATLVMANHANEMSPYVFDRLTHVQHTISGHVDRILYYARLTADHVDYKFERVELSQCVREALLDHRAMAAERAIGIVTELEPVRAVTDCKVLAFMLAQILSNAFKYTAPEDGIVRIALTDGGSGDDKIHLAVWDNGPGVSPADLPFVFDKGFTGSFPSRQSATGMGLYFVKKYADALSIEVEAMPEPVLDTGFGIELVFPRV